MHDAWFFIGVFIFIFLIWIATGGPLHPIAFTGPSLAEPQELGGGTYLQLPRAPFGVGGSNVSLIGSSNGSTVSNSSQNTSLSSLAGEDVFASPSPYRGLVTMNHYVSNAGSSDPRNEYIEISVSQNAGAPVDLSEWSLSSGATGNASIIPKGTEVPSSGTINAAQDIILSPGTRALIISGRSPIGASFRENKCIGYFSTFQKFIPDLPQTCPAPASELSSSYVGYIRDSACIDYVNKLSRCQVVLTPPVTLSGSCQSFLVKYLNYNGCTDAHRSDTDFKGDTWHIYLGRTNAMWRTRNEIVKLVDVNGKTVDAFSY